MGGNVLRVDMGMALEHIEITLANVLLREIVMGNTCVELNHFQLSLLLEPV